MLSIPKICFVLPCIVSCLLCYLSLSQNSHVNQTQPLKKIMRKLRNCGFLYTLIGKTCSPYKIYPLIWLLKGIFDISLWVCPRLRLHFTIKFYIPTFCRLSTHCRPPNLPERQMKICVTLPKWNTCQPRKCNGIYDGRAAEGSCSSKNIELILLIFHQFKVHKPPSDQRK